LQPTTDDRPRDAAAVASALANHLAVVEQRLRQAELDRAAAEARADEEQHTRHVAQDKARIERRARRLTLGLAVAVLVLFTLGGAAAWWLQTQTDAQRREVLDGLSHIEELRNQGRWKEAQAVLQRTRSGLGDNGASDLRQRLDEAALTLKIFDELDAIRLNKAATVAGYFDYETADMAYADLFQRHNLGRAGEDAAVVAERVCQSPIKAELLAAYVESGSDASRAVRRGSGRD
jgi:hypothetical protein